MADRTIRLGEQCYSITAVPTTRGGWAMHVQLVDCSVKPPRERLIDIDIEFDSEQEVFANAARVVEEIAHHFMNEKGA
ncbi:hypothetical protein [Paraburkholderia sacchari]|uniref:hypothetical protein n=1 Tax=Paraburkholderia sacchari TaxID=159450 RepID=UPI0039A680D4